ncbi:HAD family hydrolase [Sphingosinicella terrae]|jgi:HAD superfamily hydrolase (TIGR01490 family)|uniref:HAD family hydrolase n=1 Tax=Sphingosinicella terrae TaxID=2172047 RepID=UPI000E0D00AF|nr:HAD-IB family phosphatase [Sphingosinicella terrae]
MRQTLAIYDMDKTVTRRPTYGLFLVHALRRVAPWRILLAPALLGTGLLYLAGRIDRARLKEINFRLLIGPVPPERLEPVVASFAERQLASNIMEGARRRIAEDKAAGRRLVLATASYRLYAAAIAERLGFDDVIATDTLPDEKGRIVARIDGRNCYGAAKLDMIEAWLQREGLEREALHIRFYSDHISDAPVHHWSDEAFATNADERLIRLAEAQGWEVLDWRDRRRLAPPR